MNNVTRYGIWPGSKVATFVEGDVKTGPNGIDLVPIEVVELPVEGTVFINGKQRGYLIGGKFVEQSEAKVAIVPDGDGFYNLKGGRTYEVRFPKVTVPREATGFAYPRSTFNRLGIIKLETAVWDSGYSGEGTQVFYAVMPAKIHRDEAWVQLVFIDNKSTAAKGYKGYYQHESRKNKCKHELICRGVDGNLRKRKKM